MIKCEISKGKREICINGTLIDLVAESMMIVRGVYETIGDKDEDAAKRFKELFEHGEKVLFIPTDDAIKEIKKDMPKAMKKKLEVLDELISLLGGLLDEDEDTDDEED